MMRLPWGRRVSGSSIVPVSPRWAPKFFDRTCLSLWNFGMYEQEELMGREYLDLMCVEAKKLRPGARPRAGYNGLYDRGLSPSDWDDAPQLLLTLNSIVTQFTEEMNARIPNLGLDTQRYAAHLTYMDPLSFQRMHIDNPKLDNDARKVAVVFFLNPQWKSMSGGEWRFQHLNIENVPKEDEDMDKYKPDYDWKDMMVTPNGDRIVVFWADEKMHEIFPVSESSTYLTVWLYTSDLDTIGIPINPASLFEDYSILYNALNAYRDSESNALEKKGFAWGGSK